MKKPKKKSRIILTEGVPITGYFPFIFERRGHESEFIFIRWSGKAI